MKQNHQLIYNLYRNLYDDPSVYLNYYLRGEIHPLVELDQLLNRGAVTKRMVCRHLRIDLLSYRKIMPHFYDEPVTSLHQAATAILEQFSDKFDAALIDDQEHCLRDLDDIVLGGLTADLRRNKINKPIWGGYEL